MRTWQKASLLVLEQCLPQNDSLGQTVVGNGRQLGKQAAPFLVSCRGIRVDSVKASDACSDDSVLLWAARKASETQYGTLGDGMALPQQRHWQGERGKMANCVLPQSEPEDRLYADTSSVRSHWSGAFSSPQSLSEIVGGTAVAPTTLNSEPSGEAERLASVRNQKTQDRS